MKTNKHFLAAACAALCATGLNAQVSVTLPSGSDITKIDAVCILMSDMMSAKSQSDPHPQDITADVANGKAQFDLNPAGAASYAIKLPGDEHISFYAQPGEKIDVNIQSLEPFAYTCTGTELVRGLSEVDAIERPFIAEQKALMAAAGDNKEAQFQDLYGRYVKAMEDYIAANAASEAALPALLNLSGEQSLEAYSKLAAIADKSIMAPMISQKIARDTKAMELEKKQQELMSGNVDAPAFTLPDVEGKMVSLSDFKGKWVILDFWGSWCMWCVKGFPHLKEAYEKYKPELEVIGIDCQEPQDAWKAAVEKFKLPWVNVYNAKEIGLEQKYGIQGFPTNAIINPEGKIVDVTTGDDPEFYTRLAKFIGR